MQPTGQVVVAFSGSRGGTRPLSWGQRAIWGAAQRLAPDDASFNLRWVTALEAEGISFDTPLDRLTDTVRHLLTQHESLRTLVRTDAGGEPYQVLVQSGQLAIEVVDATGAEPAEVAAALRDRLAGPVLDFARELPLRVGAVRTGGFLTHAVFVVNHIATDRGGLDPLVRDVLDRLGGKPLPADPPARLQPWDQAAHQESEAGRRQSEKALRYWESKLRSVPASRFPGPPRVAREPRYWIAVLNSPAMDLAVTAIAARRKASSSAVLLATAAVMLARQTSSREAVLQLIVNNRFRPGLADCVCPASQDGLCVVEVGDDDFDTVVGRAARASLQAYMHSQYDPAGLDRLLDRLGEQQGAPIDLSCSFNDRRFDSQTPVTTGAVVSPDELRAALPATRLVWDPPLEQYGARYFLHINAAPQAVELYLVADTEVLPPEDMEAYLRGMESLVVDAACRPATVTG